MLVSLIFLNYTVKQGLGIFPSPSRDVTYQTFPGEDGKIANLFLQCMLHRDALSAQVHAAVI
jgi:hypothetical protein